MIWSLSIDRTSLALSALVITNDPANGTGLTIAEDGLSAPDFELVVAYAPDSFYVHGQHALAASVGAGGIQVTNMTAKADSAAALETVKTTLATALAQWKTQVTLSIDGQATTYRMVCPVIPKWGTYDSGMVKAHMARASFVIPVNVT